jgi:regulator of sigma E protease
MGLIQTIFYTFIALGVLVAFHEFGHFWVARRCGVRVERFSIGFGKPIYRWRDKHNTEFVLALLPLGGYVKMLDEREGEIAEKDLPYAFTQKTVWQRMSIIAAGPIANFLLAIVAFWLLFLSGERGLAPVIGNIVKDSPASVAGIEVGMEIKAVNGVATHTWGSVNRELFDYIGTTGDIAFSLSDSDLYADSLISIPVVNWLRDSENPAPMRELGMSPPFELESLSLAKVFETGAAYAVGLRDKDILVSANGREIVDINNFVELIADSLNAPMVLEVMRSSDLGDEFLTFEVIPDTVDREGRKVGQLGIQLASQGRYPEEIIRTQEYSLMGALVRGVEETISTSGFIFSSIGKLLVGDMSPKNLSGPITIAKMAGDTARAGVDNFIRFIAILSIMLGVMNLLPIPVLDGGHLLYCIIEWVKGSPVSDQVQMFGYKIGFLLLVGLMIFATFNDLTRPF